MTGLDQSGRADIRGRPDQPAVTVVVTGWRQAPHLLDCVRSVLRCKPSVPLELIVSLNEPTDGVVSQLRSEWPSIRTLVSPVNRGFAGACNRGARAGSGGLVMLLNDDTEVEPGWLEPLVDALDHDSDAGAVGSRIVSPDGSVLEDGVVLWSDGSVTLIDRDHQPHRPPPSGVRRVDYCSGAALLVRRDTWERVGGLDEGFFPAYYEDVDLCLKIQSLGRSVLYQPDSVVRHRQGASASLRYRVFLRDRNAERLRARWGPALAQRLPPAPHNPAAISRAVDLANRREPAIGPGPTVPDEVADEDVGAGQLYLQKELDITRQYAAVVTAELEQERRLSPIRWVEAGSKRVARRTPGLRRLGDLRRRRPSGARRGPKPS